MNTNLFLEPELARADMDIKVTHQKRRSRTLTGLGYMHSSRGTDALVPRRRSTVPMTDRLDWTHLHPHLWEKSSRSRTCMYCRRRRQAA